MTPDDKELQKALDDLVQWSLIGAIFILSVLVLIASFINQQASLDGSHPNKEPPLERQTGR